MNKTFFKKSFLVIFIILMLCLLCSCEETRDEIHITSAEQLVMHARSSDDIIVLDSDIDFNYSACEEISCYELRGNGYTISNVIVNSNSLFSSVRKVSNVNFDNVTVKAGTVSNAAIISSRPEAIEIGSRMWSTSNTYDMDGVHVEDIIIKNSKIIVNQRSDDDLYVGAFFGFIETKLLYSFEEENKYSIKNCIVDNVEYVIEGCSKMENIYCGGLVGFSEVLNVYNSAVNNSKMTVTTGGIYNQPYVGGLVGKVSLGCHFANSYTYNNELNINATWHSKNFLGYFETQNAKAGGFFGCSEYYPTFEYCYAESNTLNMHCSGEYYIGGFGGNGKGLFSNSYAINNVINGDSRQTTDPQEAYRVSGGFIGYANNSEVRSCYSYNNIIDDHSPNTSIKKEERLLGGLLGAAKDTDIYYCASLGNTISSTSTKDNFISGFNNNLIYQSYCDSSKYIDSGCQTISKESFIDFNTLKSYLKLTDSRWIDGKGYPARLNISK
ncbi:MAG: hypothetical protein IJY18_02645 [Clostridia bacterium]|nr:hypothetical protein [Clostridia bacterium]